MPFITRCPRCNKKLQVPSKKLGAGIQCPTCGGMFDSSASIPSEILWRQQTVLLRYWLFAFSAIMIFDSAFGLALELSKPSLPESFSDQTGLMAGQINAAGLLRNGLGLAAGFIALASSLAIWNRWPWWQPSLVAVLLTSCIAALLHMADLFLVDVAAELAIVVFVSIMLTRLPQIAKALLKRDISAPDAVKASGNAMESPAMIG